MREGGGGPRGEREPDRAVSDLDDATGAIPTPDLLADDDRREAAFARARHGLRLVLTDRVEELPDLMNGLDADDSCALACVSLLLAASAVQFTTPLEPGEGAGFFESLFLELDFQTSPNGD